MVTCPDCGKEYSLPYVLRHERRRWRCDKCREKHAEEWKINNRDKLLEHRRKWAKNNPEKIRENSRKQSLRRKYGLTVEEYESILRGQGGVCLICKTVEKRFVVDHDHKTGRVRGILCHNCNLVIGHAKESVAILNRAAKYISEE